MDLLDSYLRAVKRYLPRAQRKDIIAELSVELRAQMEEKAATLGRPLNEGEQFLILKEHGDPMVVARRYRSNRRSLAIGWELIGPELFPAYLLMLGINVTITVIALPIALKYYHVPITFRPFVFPVLIQFVCMTAVFMVLNLVRRKNPQPWFYPPAEVARMMPVPPLYSLAGLIFIGVISLWWVALPHFNFLILGAYSQQLRLTPIWDKYYLPVLLLLLASAGQRVGTLLRPSWTWLIPTARFLIDSIGAFVMFFFRTHTLVQPAQGYAAFSSVQHGAEQFNNLLTLGIFGHWLWMYLAISALVYAWYCMPHLRRWFRGSRADVGQTTELMRLI